MEPLSTEGVAAIGAYARDTVGVPTVIATDLRLADGVEHPEPDPADPPESQSRTRTGSRSSACSWCPPGSARRSP